MPEQFRSMYEPKRIGLAGASFSTGNRGVSALAESSVKLLLNRWPSCDIVFAASGYEPKTEDVVIGQECKKIQNIPIRFSKNIFHECHFLRFLFYEILRKMGFKTAGNEYFKIINSCSLVCDITGGDSFSDIYGFKRFFLGFLTKWLFVFLGKDLVMLPQTYGPFKSPLSRVFARRVLNRAEMIYSRDQEGLAVVEGLIGKSDKIRLCPDVAFVLDAIRPDTAQTKKIEQLKANSQQFVGLNISGLLYNGGYTQNNMFGLACDYQELVKNIISYFSRQENHYVLLVPHVVPKDFAVENDFDACKKVFQSLLPAEQQRVIVLDGGHDQNQIKYIIGLCDFFIGSRMHSCIAALSQGIPAIGLAYSKKFQGVFASVNLSNYVVDIRSCDEQKVLETIELAFKQRNQIRNQLEQVMPQVKENILGIFNNYNSSGRSNGI